MGDRRLALFVLLLGFGASGCEVPGTIDEKTSCRDFLQADPTEQDKAVARVADKLGVQGVMTPLARPNVNYICGNEPDATLGSAVRDSGSP